MKIGDAICQIKIAPEDYEGIGFFEPLSITEAVHVRDASLAERKRYLGLFPKVRLIACQRRGMKWFGCPASAGDSRFRIEGLAPIDLAKEVQMFDIQISRFDGHRFWFDETDMRSDPRHAAGLRLALEQQTDPAAIDLQGLSAEMRAAYEYCYWRTVVAPRERSRREAEGRNRTASAADLDPVQTRLRESLSHAGARLITYVERNDSFHVTFLLDGDSYTSAIDKENLTVFSSGICLDGHDRDFDLTSLVGVLREGRRGGEIY